MRTLLVILASASSAAFAQHTDAVARATVALEVRDKAVERCAELVRKKAPKSESAGENQSLSNAWTCFEDEGREFWMEMDSLVEVLDIVVAEEAPDA